MRLRESLHVMWRWRSVIVAGILIGVAVGWISAPGRAAKVTTYQATNTMIPDPRTSSRIPLYQVPAMVSLGAVPDRVASRLGVDRQLVRSTVSADFSPDLEEFRITARSTSRA